MNITKINSDKSTTYIETTTGVALVSTTIKVPSSKVGVIVSAAGANYGSCTIGARPSETGILRNIQNITEDTATVVSTPYPYITINSVTGGVETITIELSW